MPGSPAAAAELVETPPERPADTSIEQLGFERQPMVRWFDPTQLAQTSIRVALSTIFGAYADKRELQAAFEEPPRVHRDHAAEDELWLDFVADLGDGFRSTYALAYLLSRPTLDFEGTTLPRTPVLVMGGDQVYPTASREEYENRTLGPYRAALPWTPPGTSPQLFAIPGNHDWYDGLTNFIRFFCQDGWIGGWQTKQNRSYFAIQLPHRWWLWAIDIQFDVYIDKPQLDYFREVADELLPGDRVILVSGKPSWKHGTDHPNPSYDNLRYLEEKVIEPNGRLVVSLTGDDHHYARYEEQTTRAEKRQKVTAGGGGAFTSATHHLRNGLQLRRRYDDGSASYALRQAFPEKHVSRRLTWWALLRLWTRNWRFLRLVVAAYLVPAILLQIPMRRDLARGGDASPWDLWWAAVSSKYVLYAALVVVPLLVLFVPAKSMLLRVPLGAAHAAVHLFVLLAGFVALAAWFLTDVLDTRWATRYDLLVAVVGALAAALPGVILLAVYLAICDRVFGERLGRHTTEVFACQALEDHKNFLRLHIDRDGALTIYPIAVDDVSGVDLTFRAEGVPEDPYFEPTKPITTRLIEEPITVPAAEPAS